MTWEPKNGLHDEDVDVSDEEDGDNSFTKDDVKPNVLGKFQNSQKINLKSTILTLVENQNQTVACSNATSPSNTICMS